MYTVQSSVRQKQTRRLHGVTRNHRDCFISTSLHLPFSFVSFLLHPIRVLYPFISLFNNSERPTAQEKLQPTSPLPPFRCHRGTTKIQNCINAPCTHGSLPDTISRESRQSSKLFHSVADLPVFIFHIPSLYMSMSLCSRGPTAIQWHPFRHIHVVVLHPSLSLGEFN